MFWPKVFHGVAHLDAMAWKKAATLRSDQWSGWQLGTRIARLWGHGVTDRGGWKAQWRRKLIERESYLNTLNVTNEAMDEFAKELHCFRVRHKVFF